MRLCLLLQVRPVLRTPPASGQARTAAAAAADAGGGGADSGSRLCGCGRMGSCSTCRQLQAGGACWKQQAAPHLAERAWRCVRTPGQRQWPHYARIQRCSLARGRARPRQQRDDGAALLLTLPAAARPCDRPGCAVPSPRLIEVPCAGLCWAHVCCCSRPKQAGAA